MSRSKLLFNIAEVPSKKTGLRSEFSQKIANSIFEIQKSSDDVCFHVPLDGKNKQTIYMSIKKISDILSVPVSIKSLDEETLYVQIKKKGDIRNVDGKRPRGRPRKNR